MRIVRFNDADPFILGDDRIRDLQKFLPFGVLPVEAVFHVGESFLLHFPHHLCLMELLYHAQLYAASSD